MRLLVSWVLLGVVAGCQQANFNNDPGKNGASVTPAKNGAGGMINARKAAVDISKVPNNVDLADAGGPVPGRGEVSKNSAELDCDAQAGATIEVGPSGVQRTNLVGDPSAPEPVAIGPDGKPVGGQPAGPSADRPILPPVTVAPDAKVEMTLRGKFCPETKNRLTILFVMDYSGSMGHHFDTNRNQDLLGNDPLVNGSCGRLRAIQAVVDKLKAEKAPKDEVVLGLVPFAGGIVTDRIVNLMPLAQFEGGVNVESLCSYIVQQPSQVGRPDYAGGVTSPGVDSSTNYQAAFTAAQSLLSGVYGKKYLYFISDGEPTSGGQDPVAAGVAAGESLRQAVDNLTMNALILGQVPQAEQVLKTVTGTADRVRTADNADQLATKILDFPPPSIDEQSGQAIIKVAGYTPANLGLTRLVKDAQAASVWSWETQPFYLVGKPGEEVINEVEVSAKGRDGSTYKSQIQIKYRP